MTPSPAAYHQEILGSLHLILAPFILESNLGKVYLAPLDVRLSENDVFQPDLIFVARDRLKIVKESAIDGAPDLTVEILSPSTAGIDRDLKRKTYAQYGVKELWLIDPVEKGVALYALQEDPTEPYSTFRTGRGSMLATLSRLSPQYRSDFLNLNGQVRHQTSLPILRLPRHSGTTTGRKLRRQLCPKCRRILTQRQERERGKFAVRLTTKRRACSRSTSDHNSSVTTPPPSWLATIPLIGHPRSSLARRIPLSWGKRSNSAGKSRTSTIVGVHFFLRFPASRYLELPAWNRLIGRSTFDVGRWVTEYEQTNLPLYNPMYRNLSIRCRNLCRRLRRFVHPAIP